MGSLDIYSDGIIIGGLETGSSYIYPNNDRIDEKAEDPRPFPNFIGFVCLTTEPDYDTYVWTYDEDLFEEVNPNSKIGKYILEKYGKIPDIKFNNSIDIDMPDIKFNKPKSKFATLPKGTEAKMPKGKFILPKNLKG
jgi:hypothetical protein